MATTYYLACKCGETSEATISDGREILAGCVRKSEPVYRAMLSGWGFTDSYFNGMGCKNVAAFISYHFEHGGFLVKGICTDDPDLEVMPDCHDYASLCLPYAKKKLADATAEYRRVKSLIPEGR